MASTQKETGSCGRWIVSDSNTPWGGSTLHFFSLTPEHILDAVESVGYQCTGRCLALNSMENRVYEVEIELPEHHKILSPSERFVIVKFYRPGRWSRPQIQDEHDFLFNLTEADIPVVSPIVDSEGNSIFEDVKLKLFYAIFPKIGGRSPDELDESQCERVGRLLARMHSTGSLRTAKNRIHLSPETYGINNLSWLHTSGLIPLNYLERYRRAVEKICEISSPWFKDCDAIRIHGDCHLGNLIWGHDGPFWVDFDDMVTGPPVQDLWLMLPGRDDGIHHRFRKMIQAYEVMRPFDQRSIRLIEPLRALRFVHFAAWIAKRWDDPSFPRAFPQFGSDRWWAEQTRDLEEQLRIILETRSN
jgi:Ser/Thr protein kinase RdoA (MazF antagonist)